MSFDFDIEKNQSLERLVTKMKTFMDVCETLSSLSHDSVYKVATIIITDDFREICAIGFNGDYKGGPNNRVNFEKGQSAFLHSEENAIFHLGKPFEIRSSLVLICTHKPCTMCAKRIVNSGIKRVIFKNEYSDELNQTDEIFENSNIRFCKFDDVIVCPRYLEEFLHY